MGKLTIRLVSVEGLDRGGLMGKNDVLIKAEVGREDQKSKVYKNAGRNCDMDDVFEFDINKLEAKMRDLEFKVCDKDVLDTDTLGKCEISVKDLIGNDGEHTLKMGLFGGEGHLKFVSTYQE